MSRILITLPVWNEALVIERSLNALENACAEFLKHHEVMIEVVDNASTDNTDGITINYIQSRRINIEYRISNIETHLELLTLFTKGKGVAIRTSWKNHANDFDVFVFLDADLSADIKALPALINPILMNQAELVCGSRFKKASRVKRSPVRTFGSYCYRVLQQTILHLPVKDAQCGFKAASQTLVRSVLPNCSETGWLFDTELILHASQKGLRVIEIPISWIENRIPKRRSAFHIFKDGWEALRTLLKLRHEKL